MPKNHASLRQHTCDNILMSQMSAFASCLQASLKVRRLRGNAEVRVAPASARIREAASELDDVDYSGFERCTKITIADPSWCLARCSPRFFLIIPFWFKVELTRRASVITRFAVPPLALRLPPVAPGSPTPALRPS
jgi:hypothetical protein